jgi:aromatic ring-cleaving dioxygenase
VRKGERGARAVLEQITKEESLSAIDGYHAHVYFDPASREAARKLCEAASEAFPLSVGRMHDKAVGPHPRGSCQLTFKAEQFAELIPWLMLNRKGLTIFAHPTTGDPLKDHTDHVLWLGPSEALDLSALS